MPDLAIASAQTIAIADTSASIENHLKTVEAAARYDVRLLSFPEMSITGYMREGVQEEAFTLTDSRLRPLANAASRHNMTIVAGAPIMVETKLHIGSFILRPNAEPLVYLKRFLHDGETDFFSSRGDFNPHMTLGDRKIAFAICADIDYPQHAEDAARDECNLYVASIFFTEKSIDGAHAALSKYGWKHKFMVLMSNYAGWCWNLQAGGKSGIWASDGSPIIASTDSKECIVLATECRGRWKGHVVSAD